MISPDIIYIKLPCYPSPRNPNFTIQLTFHLGGQNQYSFGSGRNARHLVHALRKMHLKAQRKRVYINFDGRISWDTDSHTPRTISQCSAVAQIWYFAAFGHASQCRRVCTRPCVAQRKINMAVCLEVRSMITND